MRITKKMVKNKISVLNKIRNVSQDTWRMVNGKTVANIGTMYLEGHGETTHYHVLQLVNEGGAVKDAFTLEALTLRDAYYGLIGMIESTERFIYRRA